MASGLRSLLREQGAEAQELRRGAAEAQLELLRVEEVAVQRVLPVDADTAVQVLGGVHDALARQAHPRDDPAVLLLARLLDEQRRNRRWLIAATLLAGAVLAVLAVQAGVI